MGRLVETPSLSGACRRSFCRFEPWPGEGAAKDGHVRQARRLAVQDRLDGTEALVIARVPALGCDPAVETQSPAPVIKHDKARCRRAEERSLGALLIAKDIHPRNGGRAPPQPGVRPLIGGAMRLVKNDVRPDEPVASRHQLIEFSDSRPCARAARVGKHDEGREPGSGRNPACGGPASRNAQPDSGRVLRTPQHCQAGGRRSQPDRAAHGREPGLAACRSQTAPENRYHGLEVHAAAPDANAVLSTFLRLLSFTGFKT